jgi:hypothetical protein
MLSTRKIHALSKSRDRMMPDVMMPDIKPASPLNQK